MNILKHNHRRLKYYGIYSLSHNKWIRKKNINKAIYPASITKLFTALIVLNQCKLSDKIKVSKTIEAPQLRADLKLNMNYTIETLLQAMLIRSANDAANLLQEYIENKTEQRWTVITKKHCNDYGLNQSSFVNPSGLHKDNHYSTVNDLVTLGKLVYQKKTLMNILKMPRCKLLTSLRYNPVIFNNTNPFINKYGVIAGKTGFTPKAGKCFLFYFKKQDALYLAVMANTDKDKFRQNVVKIIKSV
ncbi:D-alanyl-D-alanine carboxypeptidase family protein [Desulfuribacillus alkaliarsenatis]|uniref:Peptidase S11 D-alanyl-D-alanine carboxypeptidase A N-terminal domain-containing protein n=1 Tax=Desulfuribacillus alkaliarsenatis TaxID=766136 RepID=A0A1E5G687_9FIRM|nr:serine hydrolase [Desulfuribacillus alkaliarsenatis]OEF98727.1 hypothetical protein BHF68_03450 [Desulfuribacillus alkaliarsenatis]